MFAEDREIAQLDDEQVAWDWARTLTEKSGGGLTVEARECYSQNRERVEKEKERLSKIAKRYGFPPVLVYFSPTTFVREVEVEERVDGELVRSRRKYRMCIMVTITPEIIGQDGWRVVGVKVLVGDDAVVQRIPGERVPDRFYGPEAQCDHCHTLRRRNELVIVASKNGSHAQVGKSCLKEYTGIAPEYALAIAAHYREQGPGSPVGLRCEAPLRPWLAWVAMAIRIDGRYWSHAAAQEANDRNRYDNGARYGYREQQTTVNHARTLQNVADHDRDHTGKRKAENLPTDDDRAMAERVREWVLALDPAASTWHRNVTALFRADALLYRLEGLAASAFAGYHRHCADQERRAQQAAQPSQWVGERGQRVEFPSVRVVAVREWEGDYGVTHIYKFVTPEGNVLTWFSSNDCELSAGDEVGLRGTVKDRDTYREERQTVLTRCRVTEKRG